MNKAVFLFTLCFFLTIDFAVYAQPESTTVVVRARSADAKFIGTSMGGAMIMIRDAETNEILAKGLTEGSTGNTRVLMNTPKQRYMELGTPGAAKFETVILLEEPTFVEISATAPYAQKQSFATTSTQMWLIPGKHIKGDGIILEIPGFAVDLLEPQTHESTGEEEITIRANVVMMCGCPTSPGGLWDSNEMEIKAIIKQGGQTVTTVPLRFTGKSSTFSTTFAPETGGAFEITVYAFDSRTGNSGVDKTTVIVSR